MQASWMRLIRRALQAQVAADICRVSDRNEFRCAAARSAGRAAAAQRLRRRARRRPHCSAQDPRSCVRHAAHGDRRARTARGAASPRRAARAPQSSARDAPRSLPRPRVVHWQRACRCNCRTRAAATRFATTADRLGSPAGARVSSAGGTGGTSTPRSIRSSSGPGDPPCGSAAIRPGARRHSCPGSPRRPQGQGFIAATS